MAPMAQVHEPATDRTSMQSDRSNASGHPAQVWSVNSAQWGPPAGPWAQPPPGYYPGPYFNPYQPNFMPYPPAYTGGYMPGPPPGVEYHYSKSIDNEPPSPAHSMRSEQSNVSAYDSYFYRPAIPVRSHRISIALDEDDGLTTKELRSALEAAARGQAEGYRPRSSIHSHRISIAERPRESFDSIAHDSYQPLGVFRPRPSVEYMATTEEEEGDAPAHSEQNKKPRMAPLALDKIEERASQDSHTVVTPTTETVGAMNRLGSVAQDSARSLSSETDRPRERAVEQKIPHKVVEEAVAAPGTPTKTRSGELRRQKSGFASLFSCFSG